MRNNFDLSDNTISLQYINNLNTQVDHVNATIVAFFDTKIIYNFFYNLYF